MDTSFSMSSSKSKLEAFSTEHMKNQAKYPANTKTTLRLLMNHAVTPSSRVRGPSAEVGAP